MPTTLKSRLPEIAAELRPRVGNAVRLGAERIKESARDRVPVHTGKLRDGIEIDRRGPTEYAVVAGDRDVFYGHLVEFGTSHSAAHPFLVPAAEQNRQVVERLVIEALRRL